MKRSVKNQFQVFTGVGRIPGEQRGLQVYIHFHQIFSALLEGGGGGNPLPLFAQFWVIELWFLRTELLEKLKYLFEITLVTS